MPYTNFLSDYSVSVKPVTVNPKKRNAPAKKQVETIKKNKKSSASLIAPPVAATFVVAPSVVDPVHKEPSSAAMKTALLRKNNPEYVENEKLRKQIRTAVGKYGHFVLLARRCDETFMKMLTPKDQMLIRSKYH